MVDDNSNDTTTDDALTPGGWASESSPELTDVQRTLSTFGMRIDALVTSTTSYRSAITDRLVEYTDLVSTLVRNQSSDLDEYRKANQRVLTELQRGMAASEDTISQLNDRLEKLLQGADAGDDTHRLLSEVRTVLDAQESLSRFLTEALDQFGDRVTRTLTTTHESNVEQLHGLKGILDGVAGSESQLGRTVSEMSETMRSMRESMVDVASGDVVGALWDEVRALRTSVESTTASNAADGLRADVAHLTEAIGSLLDTAEVVDPATLSEPANAISELVGDVARLRADFTEGLIVEPSGAMSETLDEIRAEVTSIHEQIRSLEDLTRGRTDDESVEADRAAAESLREEISGLTTEVRALLDQAELVDEAGSSLVAEAGEPAEGAADEVSLADIAEQVESLRVALGEELSRGADEGLVEQVSALSASMEASRSEIGGIAQRLDEGLVLDLEPTGDQQEVVDKINTIGQDIRTQLDELRATIAALPRPEETEPEDEETEVVVDFAPVTDMLEQVRDDIAHLLERSGAAAPSEVMLDPDVLDVLREDIRSSVGQVPEQLVESLRSELVALRRRIKVRAEADVLSDEQVEAIAKAVAKRLG